MNVVSKYRAAQIAGVSKQAISELDKINRKYVGKYPFFIHDPQTGKYGVNIDHPAFKYYCEKQHAKKGKRMVKSTGKMKADKGKSLEALDYSKKYSALCRAMAWYFRIAMKETLTKQEADKALSMIADQFHVELEVYNNG